VNGAALGLANKETVKVSGGPFTLSSSVLGAAITLNATEVECDEAGGTTCQIDETNAKKELTTDHSAGRLVFTGVTVTSPAKCTVHSVGAANGTVTTEALTDEIIMDPSGGTATFDKFFPEEGETFVTLELTGAECTLAGVVAAVKGTVTGRTSNTGVAAVTQSITFNAAEQATGGGVLKLGKEAATLTGVANNKLSGPNAGKTFAAF
jgi:hypothetical protein